VKDLKKLGTKIAILCIPWQLWNITGPYIAVTMEPDPAVKVTATDDAGAEILSYVPTTLMTPFLSVGGQSVVSHPNITTTSLHLTNDSNYS